MTDRTIVETMVDYYRKRAPIYDDSMGYTDDVIWAKHRAVVELLQKNLAGRDVLEIACGPGKWTQTVAEVARSIVATDVNDTTLAEAAKKPYANGQVRFQRADAYTLEGIDGPFSGAFAVDWWSHIPKARIPEFLQALHNKLTAGARVVFIDQMCVLRRWWGLYLKSTAPWVLVRKGLRRDDEGNIRHTRHLPDGQQFEIIKNFPTREELMSVLEGVAQEVEYFEDKPTARWLFAYTVR